MIGHNIKHHRHKNNMTQQEMASLAGINRTTLSRYENEVGDMPVSAVIKIARALDITPMKLMEGVR